MKTMTKMTFRLVLLTIVASIMLGAMVAQAGMFRPKVYQTTYYSIIYRNATELEWAKALSTYLEESYGAAKKVIGYDARRGKLNINFYNRKDGSGGFMYGGLQNIWLNRYYFSNYESWGSVVAHETAHVFFYNYTKAFAWNWKLANYTTFLTESLSWYAGSVVYKYGEMYSEATVKANLQYYYGKTNTILSWYDAGYYYRKASGDKTTQAKWQLLSMGYFLTGGATGEAAANVKTLLTTLRTSFRYLMNWKSSINAFENSFKKAYGYSANSRWQLGKYDDTNYLYGQFYARFYQ
jgi:hypothetical protein